MYVEFEVLMGVRKDKGQMFYPLYLSLSSKKNKRQDYCPLTPLTPLNYFNSKTKTIWKNK